MSVYELNNIIEEIIQKLGAKNSALISDELFRLSNLCLSQDQQIQNLQNKLEMTEGRFREILKDIESEDEEDF
jgi:hypothetical protein